MVFFWFKFIKEKSWKYQGTLFSWNAWNPEYDECRAKIRTRHEYNFLLFRPFRYFEGAHQVFNLHVLRTCASSLYTPFSFMSFLLASLHLSFGLPIFRCPPTSMFSLLHLLQSFSPHDLTILSLGSLIFALIFATHSWPSQFLFIPIIHLNIFISVFSSKFWV